MKDIEKILQDSVKNNFEIPLKVKYRIDNTLKNKNKQIWRNNYMKKKVIGAICAVSVLASGFVFADDIKVAVKSLFGGNTSEGVDIAVNNGYIANANTEIQSADGIKISVASFVMDDDNFAINFNIALDEKYDLDEFDGIYFDDLKIVDETGKTVFVTHEHDDRLEYQGAYSFGINKTGERNFTVSLVATGNPEAFPKSKKLTVTFTKITSSKLVYPNNVEQKERKTYEGNWEFKLDVPEEFYTRETVIYKVKSCSEQGIDISSIQATLSNTAFKIFIPEIKTDKIDYDLLHTSTPKSIYDKIALQKEYVETSEGKRFEPAGRSDGDGGYSLPSGDSRIIDYHQTFDLTKYDMADEITVHIFTNKGEEIIIEFEK